MRWTLTAGLVLVGLTLSACSTAVDETQPVTPPSLNAQLPPAELAFEIPDDLLMSSEECSTLGRANEDIPFEATPADVATLADGYRDLAETSPPLSGAANVAAVGLDAAAQSGATRTAMLAIWATDSVRRALSDLRWTAFNHCAGPLPGMAFGPPDRAIELAAYDHPGSPLLVDIVTWSMSITGEPTSVYWSYSYEGENPVALCDLLSDTLDSVGYRGSALEITGTDEDLTTSAEGRVGQECRPS